MEARPGLVPPAPPEPQAGACPAMRPFTKGTGTERKFVVFEVVGPHLRVAQGGPEGEPRKTRKELGSEAEARATCDRLVADLLARGYTERTSPVAEKARRARTAATVPAEPTRSARPSKPEPESDSGSAYADLFAPAGEGDSEPVAAALPRLAPVAAEATPKKKRSGKKKRKRTEGGDEDLDKRVIAGIVAGASGFLAFLGFLGYDMLFKPPSIVGTWGGSKIDHEIGRMIGYTSYQLVFDGQKRASMVVQDKPAGSGTYSLVGDRLVLTFQGEKDEDGEVSPDSVVEFRVTLGRATLDLYGPNGGEKLVQLVRMGRRPRGSLGRSSSTAEVAAAPKDLSGGAGDEQADARIASTDFAV